MIRVEEDARDKAVALSERYDLPMKTILSKLIDLCEDHNLLKPGWDISKILIEDDATKKAIALSQRYGLPMKSVISTLIDLCVDYDLLKPGWDKRLNAAMDKGEIKIRRDELAKLKNRCVGLFYADEFYRCIQGREDNTPNIKKLAKNLSEALEGCAGCGETKVIRLENLELRNKVSALENKLGEKSNQTFKVPVCNAGAILSKDGTQFRDCRRSPRVPVIISEFCMKRDNGLPCAMFARSIIGVGKTQ